MTLQISPFNAEYPSNEIPTQILRRLWVCYGVGEYVLGQIRLAPFEPSDDCSKGFETVLLTTVDVVIDIPACEIDIKGKMLKVLEAERQKVLAENHFRLKDVEDRIAKLTAIEYQPGEV